MFGTILLFSGLAFVLSYGLNRLMPRWFSGFGQNKDKGPQQFRWNHSPKPLTGGIALAMPVLAFVLYAVLKGDLSAWLMLFFAASLFAGLADDLFSLKPLPKLTVQFLCGLFAWQAGLKIEMTDLLPLNIFLTCFFVSALMNSVNMLDNMDGVAGFATLGILLPWLGFSHDMNSLLLWVLAFSLVGFLLVNSYPSKVFMGDSGSHFLGGILCWFCLEIPLDDFLVSREWISNSIILYALLFYPLTDSLFVTGSRIIRRQSPFIGGRDHFTHLLVRNGLRQSQVPWILFATNMGIGIWVHGFKPDSLLVLVFVFVNQSILAFFYYRIWNYNKA